MAKPDEDSETGLIFKGDGTLLQQERENCRTVKEAGQAGLTCDRTFVDAVLSGDASQIRSPYADAIKSLAFTMACNESMATGLPVKLMLAD